MNGEVRVFRGLPGSGKSTLASGWKDALICSADDFHMENGVYNWKPENAGPAHSWCLRKYLSGLEHAFPSIIVDNTNITIWEMAPYCALALAFDYKLTVFTVGCDVELAVARNIHKVPRGTILSMAANMALHTPLIPRHWNHETL
jgi:predicted kinase